MYKTQLEAGPILMLYFMTLDCTVVTHESYFHISLLLLFLALLL